MIAKTPKPPYYAVIFTSIMNPHIEGYSQMASKMIDAVSKQKGYLGSESVREEIGITVSYWQNLEDIVAWKENMDHQIAQQKGRSQWYENYKVRISKVERDYEF